MRLVLDKITPLVVLAFAGVLTGQTRQACVVARVLDSCRVELDSGEIVRLIGVQAFPNSSSNLIQSNSFPASLVIGKSLWLESDDHWPADFGYLWFDSLLINAELLRRGLVRVWDDTTGFKYQEIFLVAEHKARMARRGHWKFVAFLSAENDNAAAVASDTVYVTPSGKKYHRAGCRLLSANKTALPLSQARLEHEPCRLCTDAPIAPKKILPLESSGKKVTAQCLGQTRSGNRCKRKAETGSKYCWQHRRK
ncbi:thermonuclease family protein [candidate division KSB1 bacterium]|nr:thermonuclease family protein [candidate division KSB1 bacterium]